MGRLGKQGNRWRAGWANWRRILAVTAGVAGIVWLPGCGRHLTIYQDSYVNTAPYLDRAEPDGEPLEINIVCVRGKDLKLDVNSRLKPEAGITSDIWFERRPTAFSDTQDPITSDGKFWLPSSQIFLLMDPPMAFGTRKSGYLRGSHEDTKKPIEVDFDFSRSGHSNKSVIYVFGKFVDKAGNVMPVKPAMFYPQIHEPRRLYVRVGVDKNSRSNDGQYIKVVRAGDRP